MNKDLYQSLRGFGFSNDSASMGLGERARLGRTATRPRGAIGKTGQRPLESSHVGRAPRDRALPPAHRFAEN